MACIDCMGSEVIQRTHCTQGWLIILPESSVLASREISVLRKPRANHFAPTLPQSYHSKWYSNTTAVTEFSEKEYLIF